MKNLFRKGENQPDDDVELPPAVDALVENVLSIESLGNLMWYLRSLNLDKDLLSLGNFNIYDASRNGHAMILDGRTLAHIEVLVNSEGNEDDTLLKLLNKCTTPFGKRLFRIWLCTPLRNSKAINERLNAVEDILGNPDFLTTFDVNAKGLPDLERLLSRIHAGSIRPKQFYHVLTSFEKIQDTFNKLKTEINDFKSESLLTTLNNVPDLSEFIENVRNKFTLTGNGKIYSIFLFINMITHYIYF